MSGSMVLLQLGSVLFSMTQVTTKGHVYVHDLGGHLRLCGCLRTMHNQGTYWSECPVLPPKVIWTCCFLWVYATIAARVCIDVQGCVSIEDLEDVPGLG